MGNHTRRLVRSDLSVLNHIEDPESGHVFLHLAPSIKEELRNYDKLLKKLKRNPRILSLLRKHRTRTKETADMIEMENDEMAMVAKRKPPSPCPGTTSSCLLNAMFLDYFDLDCNEELKLFKNNRLIEAETVSYDDQTKIRTVKLAEELVYTDDDVVRIELPITIHQEDGSIVRRMFSKQIPGPGR